MSLAGTLTHPNTTEIQMTVPLYSYEQEFQGYIPERYALKLEANGVAQLVRQKGGLHKGAIRRVVMHRRPGDPKPTTLRDHLGKAYSWEQPLDDGHQPWALRPLSILSSSINCTWRRGLRRDCRFRVPARKESLAGEHIPQPTRGLPPGAPYGIAV